MYKVVRYLIFWVHFLPSLDYADSTHMFFQLAIAMPKSHCIYFFPKKAAPRKVCNGEIHLISIGILILYAPTLQIVFTLYSFSKECVYGVLLPCISPQFV
jgi:hypothetical protein